MSFLQHAPKRIRLIFLLGCFCLGIALGSWKEVALTLILLLLVLPFLGLSLIIRSYSGTLVFGGLALLLIGVMWSNFNLRRLTIDAPLLYNGQVELISLRSATVPEQRVILTILDGPKAGTSFQAYVYDWNYEVGSRLFVSATIKPSIHSSDRGRNVIGTSTQVTIARVTAPPNSLARFKNFMQLRVSSSLPEPYASLAIGLISGVSDSFDTGFKTDLQRTGTTHIVAVSGYNLTIVALVLQRLGRRRGARFGLLLAGVGILGYIFLAGGTPSVLRGAIIAFLSLNISYIGRVSHRLVLVSLGAALLSLLAPLGLLYSLSWQLSFLAFIGILFVEPLLRPICTRFFASFGSLIAETLGAEIMVLPLIVTQFGVLSLISPLVNALVLSFVPLAMVVSAIQAILSMIWLPVGRFFVWLSYPVLWVIVKPIQWLSQLPIAVVTIPNIPLLAMSLVYLAMGLLFIWLIASHRKKAYEVTA